MHVVALDIGGANIKASDGEHRSLSQPFALWQHPNRLVNELSGLLREFETAQGIAVTMTGELADCFATRAEGVDRILGAVEAAAGDRSVAVWQTGGEFLSPAIARDFTPLVAAANWHALASWGARMEPSGTGLLVDMGSTTTDLIPLVDGIAQPVGRTDLERLLSGELLYMGVRRTPIHAIAPRVRFRQQECPLAAELFATTLDVWLLTGDVAENPADANTANGGPATRDAAYDRVARAICSDRDNVALDDVLEIARELAEQQQRALIGGLRRIAHALPGPCQTVLICGEGEFLIRRSLREIASLHEASCISLDAALGPEHSHAACAYALARLAHERDWP